ncbi:MAG: hypothetical protein MI739_06670 [Bacteroidales bacterium]|nr:hypothetical protein [Bacteroidales bacterium]
MKTTTKSVKKKSEKLNLSPPWYQLQRIFSFSVGQSGMVTVSELNDRNQITITAQTEEVAKSLASTLKLEHKISRTTVQVIVKDMQGNTWQPNPNENSPDYLIAYLKVALINNPLVNSVEKYNNKAMIICEPTVVQFWNDNISCPDSFTSMKAATAFKAVFKDQIQSCTRGKRIGNI